MRAELILRFGDALCAESGLFCQGMNHSFTVQRYVSDCLASVSYCSTFAFKSRTNFVAYIVRDLSTSIRDLTAVALQ